MAVDVLFEEEVPVEAEIEMGESVKRLTRDLVKSAETLSKNQARYLVKLYYQQQHNRITSGSQIRDAKKSEEPHTLMAWFNHEAGVLEGQVLRALSRWTSAHFMGRWAKSIVGIGPVISAGLLANIELEEKLMVKDEATGMEVEKTIIRSTASSIWAYAGIAQVPVGVCDTCEGSGYMLYLGEDRPHVPRTVYDDRETGKDPCPQCFGAGKLTEAPRWEKNQKRPWNAELKVLVAFKMGESFVKVQNNKADFYGQVYVARKALEQKRNANKMFARQAAYILSTKKFNKETDAYKAYSQGYLPPGHIHARARRFAAKLFISHYHFMMYRNQFGKEPPAPYPIEHLGHANWIVPPNVDFERNKAK
jgi:hypothetical protein